MSVRDILLLWGESESTISAFEDNGITTEIFPALINNPQYLKELVPLLANRIHVEQNIKNYIVSTTDINSDTASNMSSIVSSVSVPVNIFEPNDAHNRGSETERIALQPIHSNTPIISVNDVLDWVRVSPPIQLVLDQPQPGPSTIKRTSDSKKINSPPKKVAKSHHTLNLKKLLEQSCIGSAILNIYKLQNSLDNTCQSHLCDIITRYYLSDEFDRLTNDDFDRIANQIVELFPREIKETYYTPPVRKRQSRDNKSGISKGKLVDKYRNTLTFLRKAQLLPSRLNSDNNDDENNKENLCGDNGESLTWLKNNIEPWSSVQENWNNTHKERFLYYQSNVTLDNIYQEYKVLASPLGHSLIDSDFNYIFPNKNGLYLNFEDNFKKLVPLKQKILNDNDKLLLDILNSPPEAFSTDYRHYLMLSLLASLLPSKTRHVMKKTLSKNKNQWKPSISESKEGIVVRVDLAAEVNGVVEKKILKLQQLDLTLQPFIIVEGDNTEIRNIYVSINQTLYKVPSILKALDLCFRSFHVFNLRYPFESEHIWLYIQMSMYQIKTKFDNHIPNIYDIVNKINLS